MLKISNTNTQSNNYLICKKYPTNEGENNYSETLYTAHDTALNKLTDNKEQLKIYKDTYNKEHVEERKEYRKNRYLSNSERFKEESRLWRLNNPDKVRQQSANKKARKRKTV